MVLIEELKTWDLVDAKFRDGENEDEAAGAARLEARIWPSGIRQRRCEPPIPL